LVKVGRNRIYGARSCLALAPIVRITWVFPRHNRPYPTLAPRASEPREPGCKTAAGQELPKRTVNKPWKALCVAMLGRLRAKRLVVLAHNLMQRALLGPTRAIVE